MIIDWFLLAVAAFFAGMVDAMVGGGGLIQVPILLAQFPQTAVATLFGTNKLASIVGTSAALWRYARAVRIPWSVVVPATLAALLGAWIGAALVSWLARETMRPLALLLLVVVATYTFVDKELGQVSTRELTARDRWRGLALGLGIGFYDGFFGPGTGSFLIFAFVRFFGMDFLRASASAKVINVATNFSALAFFASHVEILWAVGALMAVCNLAGAIVGTALALRGGSRFIRKIFLAVVVVLIAKLALDLVLN